ncbi:AbgT family transporter [Cetobacterium sp.]|uniref:AbgT family transporter n=1 Tax=Cetobacterium sp. TaxID=2071632 RepID=UPI002FC6D735
MENVINEKKTGILDWVEKIGNKIPHPFMLFFFLSLMIILVSGVCSVSGIQVIDPVKNEVVLVKNLMSSAGINFILQNMMKNLVWEL